MKQRSGRGALVGLAAEVARLDAARTSNAVGDYDETIQLIERYHRDFPNGALAPDADVVALEAVAAKRDHAETARRPRFSSRATRGIRTPPA